MTNTEFLNIQGRWCRGIDWCVAKDGRKWRILGIDYPTLFPTKKAAYERVTSMVLTEARRRAEVA